MYTCWCIYLLIFDRSSSLYNFPAKLPVKCGLHRYFLTRAADRTQLCAGLTCYPLVTVRPKYAYNVYFVYKIFVF